MTNGIDFLVHQRFDFMGARISHHDETEIVADERRKILVRQDRRRRLEDVGFLRIVDNGFHVGA